VAQGRNEVKEPGKARLAAPAREAEEGAPLTPAHPGEATDNAAARFSARRQLSAPAIVPDGRDPHRGGSVATRIAARHRAQSRGDARGARALSFRNSCLPFRVLRPASYKNSKRCPTKSMRGTPIAIASRLLFSAPLGPPITLYSLPVKIDWRRARL